MNCPECNTDITQAAKFCTQCGHPLPSMCKKCNEPVGLNDRFCGSCGQKISDMDELDSPDDTDVPSNKITEKVIEATPIEEHVSEGGEVTILFADIQIESKQTGPLIESSDINHFLPLMHDIVEKYNGFIDKYKDSYLMAIFGAHIVSKNHANLAVKVAIETKNAIEKYLETDYGPNKPSVAVKFGITTGLIISQDKDWQNIMGDTVDFATHLVECADHGKILVSEHTYELTRSLYQYQLYQTKAFSNLPEDAHVYEVLGTKETNTFIDFKLNPALALIGRDSEIQTIREKVSRLKDGSGQNIFLISDKGIGKNRIQEEIFKTVDPQNFHILEGICQSMSQYTSFHVFIDIFKKYFSIEPTDSYDLIGDKISSNIKKLSKADSEELDEETRAAIVYIAYLMGCNLEKAMNIPLSNMEEKKIKKETLKSIDWFFNSLAATKPVILIFENLHYADSNSIQLFLHILKNCMDKPILMLVLMRQRKQHASLKIPSFSKKLLKDRSAILTLNKLIPAECDDYVKQFLQTKNVPENLLSIIQTKSEGVPSIIEEILSSLMEEGYINRNANGEIQLSKNISAHVIPDSFNHIIAARLAKMPNTASTLIKIASVIGFVFNKDLLSLISGDAETNSSLKKFVKLGYIIQSQDDTQNLYCFRNISLQVAVYDLLSADEKAEYHLKVAQEIQKFYKNQIDAHVEELAFHYHRANSFDLAFDFLIKAGINAKKRYSNNDAIRYFKLVLRVAEKLPNRQTELIPIHVHLSKLYELLGYMDAAISSWEDARKLMTNKKDLANSLREMGRIFEKKGVKETSLKYYEKAYKILKNYPGSKELGLLLMNHAWVLFRMKELDEAERMSLKALKIFEKHKLSMPIAHVCNNLAVIYEHKKAFNKAINYNKKSYNIFSENDNEHQSANVLLSLALNYSKLNHMEEAVAYLNRSLVIMDRLGNQYGIGTVLMAKGRCYLDLDELESAEDMLKQALEIHQKLNLKRKIVTNKLLLCNLYLLQGNVDRAMGHLDSVKKIAKEENFVTDMAKSLLMEARFLTKKGKPAEAQFKEAIKLLNSIGRYKQADEIKKELQNIIGAV